jgi:hypothetical protein
MSSAGSFGEWIGRNLLFSDVIESDKRAPFIIFTVPASVLRWFGVDHGGNKFGLLAPCIEFWIALVMVREQSSYSPLIAISRFVLFSFEDGPLPLIRYLSWELSSAHACHSSFIAV